MIRRIGARRLQVLAIVFAAAALGVTWGWWNSGADTAADGYTAAIRVEPAAAGYVGSRICADCHREIWKKYQRHPMSHSLASVVNASPIEDYDDRTTFEFPRSRQYRVERDADQVMHHERMTDELGDVVYDQAVGIDYALGSGKRGRSYLFDREGLLYISPIAWYSGAARWDAAPGYLPLSHPRFERRANDKCLSCHAGRLSFDRRISDRYGEPPFQEASIGCERCHGPGAGHVERHTSVETSTLDDDIVNPAALEREARGDICHQCHLLDDLRILRRDRSIHDFRPGMRLEDVWAVLIGGPPRAAGGAAPAVNQVHQMRDSVCFQASGGKLECLSCHDPHGVPDETGRVDFYNERCLNCHRDQGCALPAPDRAAPPAAGSCIACHMPPEAASNVPHTSQTDHRIRRLANTAQEHPVRELEFFDGSDSRLTPDEVERARALAQILQLDQRPDAAAAARLSATLTAIVDRAPDDVDALEALGILCLYQGRPAEAQRCWQQALQLRPLHEGVLQHLFALQSQSNDVSGAIGTARRILRTDPWQAEHHIRLAQLLEERGDLKQAVIQVERGLEINPTLLPIRNWLADAYRRTGRISQAQREKRIINRMRDR